MVESLRMMRLVLLVLLINVFAAGHALSQQSDTYRINELERRLDGLERKVKDAGDTGLVLILFGAFCALWAQNTGRNAWLWFFLGVFFSAITVLFLLTKNASDNFERREFGRTSRDRRGLGGGT